jgi:hypothetical protein
VGKYDRPRYYYYNHHPYHIYPHDHYTWFHLFCYNDHSGADIDAYIPYYSDVNFDKIRAGM